MISFLNILIVGRTVCFGYSKVDPIPIGYSHGFKTIQEILSENLCEEKNFHLNNTHVF